MSKKQKIEVLHEWNKFIKKVFPAGMKLPPLQVVEMKRAFYAGFGQAIVIMFEKVNKIEDPDEATEAINNLYAEVEKFWSRQVQYRLKPGDN